MTPDGARYLAAVSRQVPYPFHFRWLLPFVLRKNIQAWEYVNRGAIIGIGLLTMAYTGSFWMGCVAFLPVFTLSWKYPILVDAPAMFLALASAVVWPYSPIMAVGLVLIAGCVRETSPVWAAGYAWNPILLIGLVPVALRTLRKPGPDVFSEDGEHRWILEHPFQAGLKYHAETWRDAGSMILPWGGLVLALANVDAQLIVAIALGYAQLLVATDSVRLYQWSAPVVALACMGLPEVVLPFVALSVVFNPWAGNGV